MTREVLRHKEVAMPVSGREVGELRLSGSMLDKGGKDLHNDVVAGSPSGRGD